MAWPRTKTGRRLRVAENFALPYIYTVKILLERLMNDLIAQAAAADFESRAVMPVRELGAYEALWAGEGASFKTLADTFRKHPGSIPSDFVSQREAEQYSRMALGTIREAGHSALRHSGTRSRRISAQIARCPASDRAALLLG